MSSKSLKVITFCKAVQYRCTLGEYWKNDTCLKCPEHQYGDGVYCHVCPPGFQVDQGFCHKDLTQKIVVAAFIAFLTLSFVLVVGVVLYKVKRCTKKPSSGSVKMSELTEPSPGNTAEMENETNPSGPKGCEASPSEVSYCEAMPSDRARCVMAGSEKEDDNLYESLKETNGDQQ